MLKKMTTLVFVFPLLFSLFATGAMASDIVFKVATAEPDDSINSKAFLDFKKFVEEKTNGRVEVQYFSNGVLGGEREIIEGLTLGTIQMCLPGSSVLSMYGDKFNILELPFVYDSFEVAYAVLDGEVGDTYNKWIEEHGMQNLGWAVFSARGFGNKLRPVRKPDDMKGTKLRVVESKLYIDTFKAFGANPTPMALPEIYTALQQGTVEAIEQGPAEICANKFNEQLKYYTWLKHIIMPIPFLVNTNYMENLPPDVREVIVEGVERMEKRIRVELYEADVAAIETMRERGLEVIPELPAQEMAVFRAQLGPIYAEYRKIVGDELFDKMLSYNK